jgi:hypothetical protein
MILNLNSLKSLIRHRHHLMNQLKAMDLLKYTQFMFFFCSENDLPNVCGINVAVFDTLAQSSGVILHFLINVSVRIPISVLSGLFTNRLASMCRRHQINVIIIVANKKNHVLLTQTVFFFTSGQFYRRRLGIVMTV